MYKTLCRAYRDTDGQRKDKDPSEERPKLSVSFSSSCSPKLSVSITIDQLARFGLIAVENDSVGG